MALEPRRLLFIFVGAATMLLLCIAASHSVVEAGGAASSDASKPSGDDDGNEGGGAVAAPPPPSQGGAAGDGDDDDEDAKERKAFVKAGGQSDADVKRVGEILKRVRASERSKLDKKAKEKKSDADEARLKAAKESEAREAEEEEKTRKQHAGRNDSESHNIAKLGESLHDYLYQGDIALTPAQAEAIEAEASNDGDKQRRRKRQARQDSTTAYKWPRTVPYNFDATVSTTLRTLIQKALVLWQSRSCLTFALSTVTTAPRLMFSTSAAGCWSYVGKIGSASQTINIGAGCERIGIIAHEVGHALGFWHGQSRWDRDSFVYYDATAVQAGSEDNFIKYTTATNNNYAVVYDYGSLMHYADTDFSVDGTRKVLLATATADWQRAMGQRKGPSFNDLLVMNKYYTCTCATNPGCYNGGFANPKNCAVCVCPDGLNGDRCEYVASRYKLPPAGIANTCTGAALTAVTTGWKTASGVIGSTTQVDLNHYASCHWIITAPVGYRVALEVTNVDGYCTKGCFYGNVEIKFKAPDWGRTGVRMCCASDLGATGVKSITSVGRLVVVNLFSTYWTQRFQLRYKAIV